MKRQVIIMLPTLTASMVFSQVGINTENPQATFHIDGAKDNPVTGTPSATQVANDVVVTSAGSMGIGTISPSNSLEIKSGAAGTSGLTFTNLMNAQYLGTDGAGKVIVAGNSDTAGVGVTKQRLVPISNTAIVTSASGLFSFRNNGVTPGSSSFWQIRYNGTGTGNISGFVVENWSPTGYSVQSGTNSAMASGTWYQIPGSTNIGSTNELNIFRIYDLNTGITIHFEGNLINSGGTKESMIVEEF